MQNLISECIYEMVRNGLDSPPNDTLNIDTPNIQRYSSPGSRGYDKPNWYRATTCFTKQFTAYLAIVYGSWKIGDTKTYSTDKDFSDEDKKAVKIELKRLREEARAYQKQEKAEKTRDAQEAWKLCSHEQNQAVTYLERKKIRAHKLGYTKHSFQTGPEKWEVFDSLAITLSTLDDTVTGIQYINSLGQKVINGVKGGSFHLLGKIHPQGRFFIAEGYATAATIYEVTGCPCIMAVDCHNLKEVAKILRERYKNAEIVIAADNDVFTENNPGLAKAKEAQLSAKAQLLYPVFENIQDRKLTDWNDFFIEYGLEKTKEELGFSIKAESQKIYDNFLSINLPNHFIVEEIKTTQVTNYLERKIPVVRRFFHKPKDLFARFCKHKVVIEDDKGKPKEQNLFQIWLDDKRQREYSEIDFCPDQPAREFLRGTNKVYNTWTGFAADPKKGNCELFKAHILEVICAGYQDQYEYLWKLLATWVQKPEELTVGLIIVGGQGSGKGIFTEIVGEIFGDAYLMATSHEQILGKFNAILMGKLLVHLDEALFGGHKSLSGTLKARITEKTITIEQKFMPAIVVRNCAKYIFTSNEENAVPIDVDDRRFFQLRTSDHRKRNKSYFKAILEEARNGGVEAFLYELLETDISEFEARQLPEVQRFGFVNKLETTNSFYSFLHQALEQETFTFLDACAPWTSEILCLRVQKEYANWCKEKKKPLISDKQVGNEMFKIFGKIGLEKKKKSLEGFRSYYYFLPSIDKMKKEFAKFFGIEEAQVFPE